ncbi:hypothetical protein BGZ65_001352, partial [Modicella reniformis]
MVFGSTVPSHLGALSLQQALELTNIYLENAYKTGDKDIALVLCHDAKVSLPVKNNTKKQPDHLKDVGDQVLRESVASAYIDLVKLLDVNVGPPTSEIKLPEVDERLTNTPQLVCCLGLLQASRSPDDILEPIARNWLQTIEKDTDEQERLKVMATDVIRAFKRDEIKDAKVVAEVIYLAPVLDKDAFRDLFQEFYKGIDQSGLLDVHMLEGLAHMVGGAGPGYLQADDLVKILELLSTRLKGTHQQSPHHIYRLTMAVSRVLDAMADTEVKDLDRANLHKPLTSYLEELKGSSDPYLVYQAAYAYQALTCVPDNESLWKAGMRRTGKVIQGFAGLVSAVKGLDLNKFIDGLDDIQRGFTGISEAVKLVKTAYVGVTTLAESGQSFLKCLKEGFSFERKCAWYSALRGSDSLIRDGELAKFKKLVCEVPCRRDPGFQWGVCQRLGRIAANPTLDADTRESAISFLGEIYKNDAVWGQQVTVKQWIVNLLMLLATPAENGLQLHVAVAASLLQELDATDDAGKQTLLQACRKKGPSSYPLIGAVSALPSPSLLDRVQNRPDVEANLRQLRKQRLTERGNAVYIPPQAKANSHASNDSGFPLMENVKEFLRSDRKVFLLSGDSGAGKSTFNRELECDLWQAYTKNTGRIPLHINLPAIDKPEHDMIAKQLRKAEFTEPQIRELKFHRKFILICDGYDESQQTHNLYTSNRLNQPGEWDAQMVISCRSEYLGVDYRDRFQPGDRNNQSDPSLFLEAVITPFTLDQIQAYIKQYVFVHQPLWQTEDYNQALESIPSLKDLVTNPFLMSLSLEVLPRMMDPGQQLSATRVTRVALYDQFVEQWLERGKKRLGEKDLSPQARSAFEGLSDEGFTQHGIEFLKNLAVAIYKKQDGHPVVIYSRVKGELSWKDLFFSRDDEKKLLREACPLTRKGNQHRFIHRSLLEYGLALAVFDPQDWRESSAPEPTSTRRGSVSSIQSFEIRGSEEDVVSTDEHEPDLNSPLVWRDFVNDSSLLQFLEERVQQEPVFKQQLLAYIEHSKKDKKWRTAAANSITILVRAGVQFIGEDLRYIRIPGADLSYGVFDSTQLQGADLRKANLRGVWLRQADLSRTQMTGVQFGELPLLTEDSEVKSSAYSPDGVFLAVGLFNGDVNVYTISTWEKTRKMTGHSGKVRSLVYSPKGVQMASGSEDKTVRLWEVESGKCLHTLTDHGDCVVCVVYSPQGDQLASVSDDNTVRLWDIVTGECLRTLTSHVNGVFAIVYSPNGNQIVTASSDHTVQFLDVGTGVCSNTLMGHSGWVRSVVYSPQGDLVASASDDMTIRLWDVSTGTCRQLLTGHTNAVYSVAYSPKGGQVASASVDATVRLWDVESGACRQILTGHSGPVLIVAYSPQGDQLASGSYDKTVRLWDLKAGASRHVASGHSADVMDIMFSLRGGRIASGSRDSTIRLWDVETGACRKTLRGQNNTVFGVAYSPQGDLIASGGADKTLRLWDVETETCRHTLTDHRDIVYGVAFSPQGDQIASASDDKTVKLWDVRTGDCQRTLTGHTGVVFSVVYSPNGNQIASSSGDKIVRLWDAETGVCNQSLIGHSDVVTSVVYSPQGDQLASASFDKTVRLWDVETGVCSKTLIVI